MKTPDQCETILSGENLWTVGGIGVRKERCENNSTKIVTEVKTGERMGCCSRCLVEFKRINRGEMKLYKIKDKRP